MQHKQRSESINTYMTLKCIENVVNITDITQSDGISYRHAHHSELQGISASL